MSDGPIIRPACQGIEPRAIAFGSRSRSISCGTSDIRLGSSNARKLLLSGVIHIIGRLDIDDALIATVSDLKATGEGAIGSLAAGIVQGKLKPFNGKKIPLMAFSLGDVALRDLKIAVKNNVQVTAQFGH